MTAADQSSGAPLLQVEDLHVWFRVDGRWATAVDGMSLHVDPGEVVGLIGESGCGKSVTARALLGLVGGPNAEVSATRLEFDGLDLTTLDADAMRMIRGRRMAMITQDPMTALNPSLTVGTQVADLLRHHQGMGRRAAVDRATDLLDRVGIRDAARRHHDHPHQLSGGMRQRVLIAMALAGQPDLLIADEPTTALDTTVQAQVLDLLLDLREEFGMAILLVTHDLGLVAQTCSRVLVAYAGSVVETAPTQELFERPRHPYTAALIGCAPGLRPPGELVAIPGAPPVAGSALTGCRFAPRCAFAAETCERSQPTLQTGGRADPGHAPHAVACVRADELRLEGVA